MKIKYKDALVLLKDNGFELLHQKGSHMKFGKTSLRFIMTKEGWKGSGILHSKQSKELLEIIEGKETSKTLEEHKNEI